jgi:hypothetical protein
MSEFGYKEIIIPGLARIDSWGAGPFAITVGPRRWLFEDSDRFGPYFVHRDGREDKRWPSERSPFWRAHYLWIRQGRKVAEDGETCVWTEPKPNLLWIEKRTRILHTIEPGEPDGLNALLPDDDPRVRALQAQGGEDG